MNGRCCKGCGQAFTVPSGPGRRPDYCPACRSTRRSSDKAWRDVRAQVLREEPQCSVPGCGQLSTTVDHRIPLSRGGARLDRRNLTGMCARHNFSKGDRMPGDRELSADDVPEAWSAVAVKYGVCSCGDPACIRRRHL